MNTIETRSPPWDTGNTVTAIALEQPKRSKVCIKYNRPSSCLKLSIKPSLFEELKKTSEYLGNPSGLDFSMSIIARRALERYAEDVQALSSEAAHIEALHLNNFYR